MKTIFKNFKLLNKEINTNLNLFQLHNNFRYYCEIKKPSLLKQGFKYNFDESQIKYFNNLFKRINEKEFKNELDLKLEINKVFKNIPENFENLPVDKKEVIENEIKNIIKNKIFGPKYFTDNNVSDIIKLWEDEKSRKHFIGYLGSKQYKTFKTACLKKFRKISKQQNVEDLKNEESLIFLKKKKSNYVYEKNLWSSAIDGQNIILDFSFSNDLLSSSNINLVSHLIRTIKFNEQSEKPFNVWFTSFNKELQIYPSLKKLNLFNPKNFINKSEKHFIDLFPKEKLIYLSPDADEKIDKFDNQAVYILGAIIDRHENIPLTYDCAKKLGIKSLKLPLEDHVILSNLSLDLSCFNVFQMLNYMQHSYAKWDNAFRMYLPEDRKKNEFEIISESNSPFYDLNDKEIHKYKKMIYYSSKHKIFKKLKTQQ